MTVKTLDAAVGEYVGRCFEHLRDLPTGDRDEILDDIRQMVTEVSSELDGDPADLLGPPDRFVDELRRAAGLAPQESEVPEDPPRPVSESIREALETIRELAAVRWMIRLVDDMRPAGWVIRGYALGAFVSYVLSDVAHADILFGFIPVPHLFGYSILGGAVVAAFVVLSVEVGRRRFSGWARLAVAAVSLFSMVALAVTTQDLREHALNGAMSGDMPMVVAEDNVPPLYPIITTVDGDTIVTSDGQVVTIATLSNPTEGTLIEVPTLADVDDAWEAITGGDRSVDVTVQYQGRTAVANSPDALAEILASWGFPG